ncbi:MAG: hypothetical protein CL454_11460 [Acidimicrobiaceae bacterium]|nr:hypothetical protein [Acidimicrobiaceae bacterium]|tara:strand:- start:16232 stop:17557 length:1326 start_codon:yes stop_codon:yes gene_type:complete
MEDFFKKQENKLLIIILFISIISKYIIYIYYGDFELANEWSVLYKNLDQFGVLSFHNPGDLGSIPNSYMPPLYPYFIYYLSKINFFGLDLAEKVIFIQVFLSCISIIIIFNFFKYFFDYKFSFISTLIYTFYPLNIYATVQISSISISIFLLSLFLFFYIKISKNKIFYSLCLGFFSGLLILARGEFFLLFFLLLINKIIERKTKYLHLVLVFFISLIVISPYLNRNLEIFDKFTITESKGYNLWRGNNQLSTVDSIESHNFIYNTNSNVPPHIPIFFLFSHPENILELEFKERNKLLILREKINDLEFYINGEINNKYDVMRDKIFLDEAVNNILENPSKYFVLSLKKAFSIIFINLNSSYKNYYNIYNIIPELVISILAFIGFFKSFTLKKNYLFHISYIFYILIFSIFFVLPRYKLLLLPMLIFFSINLIKTIHEKKK